MEKQPSYKTVFFLLSIIAFAGLVYSFIFEPSMLLTKTLIYFFWATITLNVTYYFVKPQIRKKTLTIKSLTLFAIGLTLIFAIILYFVSKIP